MSILAAFAGSQSQSETRYRPQDYFEGEIEQDGAIVSKIYGSYVGFLEFDGVRYWDAREDTICIMRRTPEVLPSDASYRADLQSLAHGNVEVAQRNKERLEELQRHDAKLRVESKKATGRK